MVTEKVTVKVSAWVLRPGADEWHKESREIEVPKGKVWTLEDVVKALSKPMGGQL